MGLDSLPIFTYVQPTDFSWSLDTSLFTMKTLQTIALTLLIFSFSYKSNAQEIMGYIAEVRGGILSMDKPESWNEIDINFTYIGSLNFKDKHIKFIVLQQEPPKSILNKTLLFRYPSNRKLKVFGDMTHTDFMMEDLDEKQVSISYFNQSYFPGSDAGIFVISDFGTQTMYFMTPRQEYDDEQIVNSLY